MEMNKTLSEAEKKEILHLYFFKMYSYNDIIKHFDNKYKYSEIRQVIDNYYKNFVGGIR